MTCELDGCDRPHNKDGLCLLHKLKHVNFTGLERLRRNRHETGRELTQEVYDDARAKGQDIKQRGVTSPTSGPLLT